MTAKKETASVRTYRNGQKCATNQKHNSIVHDIARFGKGLAKVTAVFSLVLAMNALTALVQGKLIPALPVLACSILTANAALGVLCGEVKEC